MGLLVGAELVQWPSSAPPPQQSPACWECQQVSPPVEGRITSFKDLYGTQAWSPHLSSAASLRSSSTLSEVQVRQPSWCTHTHARAHTSHPPRSRRFITFSVERHSHRESDTQQFAHSPELTSCLHSHCILSRVVLRSQASLPHADLCENSHW